MPVIFKEIKDGIATVFQTWRINHSKPKVWVEGHEYKFNTELVCSRTIPVTKPTS